MELLFAIQFAQTCSMSFQSLFEGGKGGCLLSDVMKVQEVLLKVFLFTKCKSSRYRKQNSLFWKCEQRYDNNILLRFCTNFMRSLLSVFYEKKKIIVYHHV
jgi:hypothetical protein